MLCFQVNATWHNHFLFNGFETFTIPTSVFTFAFAFFVFMHKYFYSSVVFWGRQIAFDSDHFILLGPIRCLSGL